MDIKETLKLIAFSKDVFVYLNYIWNNSAIDIHVFFSQTHKSKFADSVYLLKNT